MTLCRAPSMQDLLMRKLYWLYMKSELGMATDHESSLQYGSVSWDFRNMWLRNWAVVGDVDYNEDGLTAWSEYFVWGSIFAVVAGVED